MNNKVLISHCRFGRTDGVSLEIEKRIKVLKELGWDTIVVSGPISDDADYIIEELEFDNENIRLIKKNKRAL